MGVLDELTQFLETRLDEFLKNNPHLELQALQEQLKEQEKDTIRLILNLQKQEKKLENNILSIAQDIKLWHQRVEKARSANREDLAQAAQEKEASLLRLGNQRWGQMKGVQEQIRQSKDLLEKIRQRQKEVKAKTQQAQASQSQNNWGWESESTYQSSSSGSLDPLEETFRNWEVEQELEQMKQNR